MAVVNNDAVFNEGGGSGGGGSGEVTQAELDALQAQVDAIPQPENYRAASMGKQVGSYVSGRSYRTAAIIPQSANNFNSATDGVYLAPFIPAAEMPINAIGVYLQQYAAIRFAIYDASANGSPLNLLFDGAINAATAGVVNYSTVNMTLQKGKVYWLQLRTLTPVLIETVLSHGLICEMYGAISNVYQNGIRTTQTFANASPAVFPLDLAAMPDANRTGLGQTPVFLLRAA